MPTAARRTFPRCSKARGRLDGLVHGAAPAPYRALDLIEGALSGWSLEEGYAAEEEAVAELLPGPQAQASLYAFDLVERRARSASGRPDAEPRPIRKVGIVGAGLMAAQLADALPPPARGAGRDARPERGGARLGARDDRRDPRRAGRKGPLRRGQGPLPRLARLDLDHVRRLRRLRPRARGGLRGARGQAAGLRGTAGAHQPEAMLATNTSSLSVAEMGADVGIHFFNPVAVLPLVELVRTPETDDETLATAWAFAEKLRKRPVLVADAPAFVVNRVLTRTDERGARRDRARHRPRRRGRRDPPPRAADGAVRAAADGRPACREPRPRHAPRGLPRSLPALADARQLRRRP